MLENVSSLVFSVGRCTGQRWYVSFPAKISSRLLSTNSAINKGLRKSQKGRSQFDPPARLGGVTRRSENDRRIDKSRHEKPNFNSRNLRRGEHGGRFDDFRHGSLRSSPRSPLHEDEDSSSIARKRSLTQRQRRIVGTTNGKPSRKQHERSSRNSERARRESPGVSSLLPSPNPSTRSPPLNRAERRAAAFDHKENPPAGYKALPTMSAEQEDPIRQRSGKYRTLSPENVVVPKNIRQGQRWADSSDRRKGPDSPEGMRAESSDERPRRKSNAPLAIPYTTPASEFLYGHSVVTAALKFSRRRFYKLYLFDGDSAEVRGQDREVRKLALAANVEVTRVGNDWLRLMDKMSQGRPHNVS